MENLMSILRGGRIARTRILWYNAFVVTIQEGEIVQLTVTGSPAELREFLDIPADFSGKLYNLEKEIMALADEITQLVTDEGNLKTAIAAAAQRVTDGFASLQSQITALGANNPTIATTLSNLEADTASLASIAASATPALSASPTSLSFASPTDTSQHVTLTGATSPSVNSTDPTVANATGVTVSGFDVSPVAGGTASINIVDGFNTVSVSVSVAAASP